MLLRAESIQMRMDRHVDCLVFSTGRYYFLCLARSNRPMSLSSRAPLHAHFSYQQLLYSSFYSSQVSVASSVTIVSCSRTFVAPSRFSLFFVLASNSIDSSRPATITRLFLIFELLFTRPLDASTSSGLRISFFSNIFFSGIRLDGIQSTKERE